MKRLKRIFLPKWIAWFVLLILIPSLAVLEYHAFYGNDPYPELGLMFGFVMVVTIVMVFLMSYGKLPYLLIEG